MSRDTPSQLSESCRFGWRESKPGRYGGHLLETCRTCPQKNGYQIEGLLGNEGNDDIVRKALDTRAI